MRPSGRIVVALTCLALLSPAAFATPSLAAPTTPAIEAERAEAARVRAEVAEMNARLEEQIEEYNGLDEALQQTRARIRQTEARKAAAQAELARSQALLGDRAVGMYKRGHVGLMDVLLGTTSFGDLIARIDLLVRVGRSDAAVVAVVDEARRELEAAQRSLEVREVEQVNLRERAEQQAGRITTGIAEQQAYLRRVDARVRVLVAQEAARQEALARERARKAAEEAAARRAAADAARRAAEAKGKSAPGAADAGTEDGTEASGGGHPEVVDIALRYLGVPYVWGGSTPSGFDCSGLVQYSYRQIGVSLPRTSRSQFGAGTRIPRERTDLLQPGDLVFFGYGGDEGAIHHVGIYVGSGSFVHAPQTGETVRIASLQDRIAARGDYVGACRP